MPGLGERSGDTVALSEAGQDIFVGRAAELSQIGEVVDRVSGGEPWLVSIEGESGIGKSALARRCTALAEPRVLLSARADIAETDLDYGVVQQLVRRVDVHMLEGSPLLSAGLPLEPRPSQ